MSTDVSLVEHWLGAFNTALGAGDATSAAAMFIEDGHWRDLVAFTWDIQSMSGQSEIEAVLATTLSEVQPRDFHLPAERTPPRRVKRVGVETLESVIAFDTAKGPGSGILRLVEDESGPGGMKAWILMTSLEQLRGHEEPIDGRRPSGENYSRTFGPTNWQDLMDAQRAYADRDPAVIVVGGGQAGLAIAARLGVLGVDTLIVDRYQRIGDNWRKRYHTLTLHNEVDANHLPYMPFPSSWPTFVPKDKIANWFEAYAEAMELNIWCETEIVASDYDDAAGKWRVTLRRGDGSEREMYPRHLVIATGVNAITVHPDLPGLGKFNGTVMHSGVYTTGVDWAGKRALVLGTGNSGHDVAQDLQACGAEVSLIQRGPTQIVSLHEALRVYAHYFEGPPIEDCDLLSTSAPYLIMLRGYQMLNKLMCEGDRELHAGLEKAGFQLDKGGADGSGFQMKFLRRGGGYALDVGCSDLIAEGKVGLIQFANIDCFVAEGAKMKDGSIVPADLLVTATGYKMQQDVVRAMLGDEVADRIGPVWGFDEGGELRNMWCRTPQPGLWFTAGSLAQSRIYSKFLALQIKACEEGLMTSALPANEVGRAQAAE